MNEDGPSSLPAAVMPESPSLSLGSPASREASADAANEARAGEAMSEHRWEGPPTKVREETQSGHNPPQMSKHIRAEKSGKPSAVEDKDTCRICRQEESTEEPLFYPCKCSGSIKFVHQACLLQWLSHAQKKHCELCKTTFRFTKLYSPNMPSGVPLLKFSRQAVIHTYKILCNWLRVALVVVVWLGLFPYAMRCVWRGLFWLVEGGWVDWQEAEKRTLLADTPSYEEFSFQEQALVQDLQAPGSWLIDPHANNVTAAQIVLHVAKALPGVALKPFSLLLHFDQGGPLLYRLGKGTVLMIYSFLAGETTMVEETATRKPETLPWRVRPSWLSEFEYLKNLTPSPQINLIIVDVLEGQLITLSLVVIFVLLFLIREWVIQQHPHNRPAIDNEIEENAGHAPVNADRAPRNPSESATVDVATTTSPSASLPETVTNVGPEPNTPRLAGRSNLENGQPPHGDFQLEGTVEENSTSERRPKMPKREIRELVSKLAQYREDGLFNVQGQHREVGRGLETIWDRAKVSPSDIVKVIKDEGGGEDLDWLIDAIHAFTIDKEDRNINSETPPQNFLPSDRVVSNDSKSQNVENDDSKMPHVEYGQSTAETQEDELDKSYQEGSAAESSSAESPNIPGYSVTNAENRASDPSNDAEQSALRRPSTASEAGSEVSGAEVDTATGLPNYRAPRGLFNEVLDWFWGDMVPDVDRHPVPAQDEEQIAENPRAETPFVFARDNPFPPRDNAAQAENEVQDADVLAAARQAGIDPAAGEDLEDLEDMEGVMELVGFQGPVEGLFQNALFCAVLVSVVLIVGVWLPFIMGTSFVTTLSDPVLFLFKGPALLLSFLADTVVDCGIIVFGCMFCWLDYTVRFLLRPVRWFSPSLGNITQDKAIVDTARAQAEHAVSRLGRSFVQPSGELKTINFAVVSAIEHQALLHVEQNVRNSFKSLVDIILFVFLKVTTEDSSTLCHRLWIYIRQLGPMAFDILYRTLGTLRISLASLSHINLYNVHISSGRRSTPLDLSLVHWNSRDRGLAILFGYLSFTLTGAAYIHLRHWLEGKPKNEKVQGKVADFLYQMGGVLKVIVVIGIEMIIFPLYCGVLLDVALLPLFGSASISSRIAFSKTSPLTSLFVHWFIGTSYMFHFALFVATCRKLMRSGVLYFIKDPDDPDFHPVRDVLDRNLYTQLRKIASSAFIYGALIIVGLGGVIWGIDRLHFDVFPIRWLSVRPAADIPINLIFYNILVPLIVKMFKPTKAWNRVFEWWFRVCAVWLRLSSFLFGTKRPEEQGRHVRRTWRDVLNGEKGDVENPALAASPQIFHEQESLQAYFLHDGSFARVPASDAVKPPRGHSAFLPVDQYNKRLDGRYDRALGCHGYKDPKWTMAYIPPYFRLRIVALVGAMWLFLAVAGCSVTILPLTLGRGIVGAMVKGVEGISDIYAFSIGVAILPMPIHAYIHRRRIRKWLHDTLASLPGSITLENGHSTILRLVGLVYFYSTVLVVFPLLLSLILQTYIIIPLHTYFASHLSPATLPNHTVHLLQDWTLGLLYLRLILRYIFSYPDSRPARAVYLVVPRTFWQPNIWAFTRLWVFPTALLSAYALLSPPALAWALLQTPLPNVFFDPFNFSVGYDAEIAVVEALFYRYSYTCVIFVFCALGLTVKGVQWFQDWKRRIRDEVYLIGERLHNYKGDEINKTKKKEKDEKREKGKGKDKEGTVMVEEEEEQIRKENEELMGENRVLEEWRRRRDIERGSGGAAVAAAMRDTSDIAAGEGSSGSSGGSGTQRPAT